MTLVGFSPSHQLVERLLANVRAVPLDQFGKLTAAGQWNPVADRSSTRTSASSWSISAYRTSKAYKPRSNYQGILATAVESFLDNHPGFLEKLAAAPTLNQAQVRQMAAPNLDQIIEAPPEKTIAPQSTSRPWLSRKAKKIDIAELDHRQSSSW